MRISKLIDVVMGDFPFVPMLLTHRSKYASVRILGVFVYVFWFFPALVTAIALTAVLVLPALIQDAWLGPDTY
jgi:hypothetical protein